jgi:hypothetical protein
VRLYEFILSRLPSVDGYGNCGKVIDENGVSNHSAFKESIREDHEGDVGVFISSLSDITSLSGRQFYEAEVQVVVNVINGDIDGALDYLFETLDNIKNNYRDNHTWIKNCRLINCLPVGKNKNGIHWCSLNVYLKFVVNTDD